MGRLLNFITSCHQINVLNSISTDLWLWVVYFLRATIKVKYLSVILSACPTLFIKLFYRFIVHLYRSAVSACHRDKIITLSQEHIPTLVLKMTTYYSHKRIYFYQTPGVSKTFLTF